MSASAVRTRPASRPSQVRDEVRPALRVIEGAEPRRSVVPLAIIAVVVLVIAIVVPMMINTHLAERAFQIRELQLELNELDAQVWDMRTQLQEVSSPGHLEEAARGLGMVPAGSPGVISLSDGTVSGGRAAH